MNQAPTRKTLQKKTLHENQYKQIKEESFFRRKKDLENGAWPHFMAPFFGIHSLGGKKVFSGKTWFAGKVNSQSF